MAPRIKREDEIEQTRLYKSFAQQVLQRAKKIIIAAVLKEFDVTELIHAHLFVSGSE